jgi:diadenosine tetraphosphate (Ap4A) HIT family hydrolase
MAGCAFCDDKDVQARCIVRNQLVWAIPTNIPVVPGHALVLPVRHVALFDDLTADEKEAIFEMMGKIKAALRKMFGSEGFNIAWNEGQIAGQSVPHFHIHIVPRKEGDTGITQYEPRKFLYRPGSREASPEEELRAVADTIRIHLK